ncbi:MAG: DUF5677 domain-containing protein [Patescibacteria group bacterium]|jgi:hypothetical protein|nr:DUF5677 domain-containing protein [Patescibacteria group bacterium]
MKDKIIESSVDEIMGAPVDISNFNEENCSRIAFDLYKEAMSAVTVVCGLCNPDDKSEYIYGRDQSLIVGLLVRIVKFMASATALSVDKVKEHGEVILALNRSIVESAINVIYFCTKAKPEDVDIFVRSALKAEKNLFNSIQENIKQRGKKLPIEERMLKSIDRLFRASEINGIEDLKQIPRWKDYKTILREINLEWAYPVLQQIPSHSIHGTWSDIAMHHLEYNGEKFSAKLESIRVDARLLSPISKLVLIALKAYLEKYYGDVENHPLLLRVNDLIERNEKIEKMHEEILSKDKK